MRETILIGRGRQILTISRVEWENGLSTVPQYFKARLKFMSAEHHQVRYFVVRELPIVGEPIAIESIVRQLHLPASRVNAILDDLEQNLMYLYRNPQGMVAWAYPVTVDQTPHHLTFSTGERLYAA